MGAILCKPQVDLIGDELRRIQREKAIKKLTGS